MYDFDKTLCTNDMQNYSFVPSLGIPTEDFWGEVDKVAKENSMDGLLCYMYMMLKKAGSSNIPIRREDFVRLGEKIEYFPGVKDWFDRINHYGEELGVEIEHYVISSGLQEIIEGSSIFKNFKKTYACEFLYDINGVAVWPKNIVNFTTKTQFLFRINKGVLDISEEKLLNTYIPMEERRIPFRNMIYIGDGMTDVPCMKLVNSNGGHSIGVFNAETKDKTKVHKMMRDRRIKYFAPADYRAGSELDVLVKAIIDRTATNEVLESIHYDCKRDNADATSRIGADEAHRSDLIMALEASHSFAETHKVIAELAEISDWTLEEKESLFAVALGNSQVHYILADNDVKAFFSELLKDARISDAALAVKAEIEKKE